MLTADRFGRLEGIDRTLFHLDRQGTGVPGHDLPGIKRAPLQLALDTVGKFADIHLSKLHYHGDFIAVRKFDALDTVAPDLMRQL